MARSIADVSGEELLVEEGSLYPALHRLQARGLVTSEWTMSESGRRVRNYTLTATGRQQLRAEVTRWSAFSAAVSRALEAQKPRTS